MHGSMEFFEDNYWLGKINKFESSGSFDPNRLFEPLPGDNPYVDPSSRETFTEPLNPGNPYLKSLDITQNQPSGEIVPKGGDPLRRFKRLM